MKVSHLKKLYFIVFWWEKSLSSFTLVCYTTKPMRKFNKLFFSYLFTLPLKYIYSCCCYCCCHTPERHSTMLFCHRDTNIQERERAKSHLILVIIDEENQKVLLLSPFFLLLLLAFTTIANNNNNNIASM